MANKRICLSWDFRRITRENIEFCVTRKRICFQKFSIVLEFRLKWCIAYLWVVIWMKSCRRHRTDFSNCFSFFFHKEWYRWPVHKFEMEMILAIRAFSIHLKFSYGPICHPPYKYLLLKKSLGTVLLENFEAFKHLMQLVDWMYLFDFESG